ncbi:hypothetical protein AOLI_G00081450 [Acnodon oligacanthus]
MIGKVRVGALVAVHGVQSLSPLKGRLSQYGAINHAVTAAFVTLWYAGEGNKEEFWRECIRATAWGPPVVLTGVMAAGAPAAPARPDGERGSFKKLSSQPGVIYTLNRLGRLG